MKRALAAVRLLPAPGAGQVAGPASDPTWSVDAPSPWAPLTPDEAAAPAYCNVCRWHGTAFGGPAHCEGATCPRCGSVGRDRFLLWCLVERQPPRLGQRVLETSPRLDHRYRVAMGSWFDYRSSDYDERAHRGVLRLDLQAIDLPDEDVDVMLSPHVLEHVPDTDRALAEIHRILAPGGVLYLQVPVLQGRTAPPAEPEFHGDDTPVFWRFGYDLTERLRAAGFEVAVLVTDGWRDLASAGTGRWPGGDVSPEFDVDDLLAHVDGAALTGVARPADAARLGFEPSYMYLTWECARR
ncbi:MAG: class I SAM-dependent methyltransferase [Acidimicrobiia bacterium]|nr:class I SAM-dependent methyltransferase [Acidimicrobiia bacterium]